MFRIQRTDGCRSMLRNQGPQHSRADCIQKVRMARQVNATANVLRPESFHQAVDEIAAVSW